MVVCLLDTNKEGKARHINLKLMLVPGALLITQQGFTLPSLGYSFSLMFGQSLQKQVHNDG